MQRRPACTFGTLSENRRSVVTAVAANNDRGGVRILCIARRQRRSESGAPPLQYPLAAAIPRPRRSRLSAARPSDEDALRRRSPARPVGGLRWCVFERRVLRA